MAAKYRFSVNPPPEDELVSVVCRRIGGCLIYVEVRLLIDSELSFIKSEEC